MSLRRSVFSDIYGNPPEIPDEFVEFMDAKGIDVWQDYVFPTEDSHDFEPFWTTFLRVAGKAGVDSFAARSSVSIEFMEATGEAGWEMAAQMLMQELGRAIERHYSPASKSDDAPASRQNDEAPTNPRHPFRDDTWDE